MRAPVDDPAHPPELLDPAHLHTIFVSPRVRARKTFELVFSSLDTLPECEIEEGVREWEYGAYEGLKTHEIRALPGHAKWDIWTDGCEGGESSAQMSDRVRLLQPNLCTTDENSQVDAMIAKIVALGTDHHGAREDYDGKGRGDVLIVSHGHFSRCFLTRWAALPLSQGRIFVVDAGAISIAGYQHENFAERSILGLNLQNF